MNPLNHDFRYLNHEGRWSGFTLAGLELRADGSLTLAGLPAVDAATRTTNDETPAAPAEPVRGAAIAVDAEGNVYFSRPDLHRVDRVDACTGEVAPVPCLTGPGSHPGELRGPRGLLALPERGALLICDTDNSRVQLIDADTGQVLEIWSWPLKAPVAAARDRAGHVYMADASARTVLKRRAGGDWEPAFAAAVDDSALLVEPCGIAVSESGSGVHVYVLDRARHCVFVFDDTGTPVRDEAGAPYAIGRDELDDPWSLAVTGRSLYVSDRAETGATRVLRFQASPDFALVGPLPGLASVTALLGGGDRLWVQRGAAAPVIWQEQRAFVGYGWLESPVIDLGKKVAWTSLHVHGSPLARGAHVELSVRFFDQLSSEGVDWEVMPLDALHVHLRDREARYLRVRARLSGDGATSPLLTNLSVRYDQPGYLAHLPAVYGAPSASREFLVRLLALFESLNGDLDALIDALPSLFDPASIPAEFLPWLASWLAVELDEHWSTEKQRAAIARAYLEYEKRGTPDGLRRSIEFELGIAAVLVEPILQSSWWVLPGSADPRAAENDASSGAGALLGFTTSLAAAEPDSAVVGSSALDHSRILHESDYGTPLFDDVAHLFFAHVYRGAADAPRTRDALIRLIEREKPAHTSYRLLSIEPRFRVGVQASIGFDTVIAGPPEPSLLGAAAGPVQLAGEAPARIGTQSRIGQGMRL